ncbi:MAG: serine hydrolase [Actinocatenispora sp.]
MLGLGGAAAVTAAGIGTGATVGCRSEASPPTRSDLSGVYRHVTAKAGGRWHSLVTTVHDRASATVVEQDADAVIAGASIQKLAVAVAVLDKVDRGELALDQTLDLRPEFIAGGSGTYRLQAAFGDRLTLANLMVTMLQVSDNSAVQMLGRVVPGTEINDILAGKGFARTRVVPDAADPHRLSLGSTTPREMHRLLTGVADHTLVSADSADVMLRVMRWSTVGYCDGVRRVMSSTERGRIAVKHGADQDRRHEVGIVFDTEDRPAIVFAYLADRLADRDNYGATNPAVQAHAELGGAMLDTAGRTAPHGT